MGATTAFVAVGAGTAAIALVLPGCDQFGTPGLSIRAADGSPQIAACDYPYSSVSIANRGGEAGCSARGTRPGTGTPIRHRGGDLDRPRAGGSIFCRLRSSRSSSGKRRRLDSAGRFHLYSSLQARR